VLEIELSEPLADILPAATSGGVPFASARVLVRIHTWPLGFVEIDLGLGGISAATLAAAVDAELGSRIEGHLKVDGGVASRVSSVDIPVMAEPACLAARRDTLRAAPSVSVVVPTMDRPEALRRTIQDLVDQAYPDFEILVVDNAPGQSGAHAVVSSIDARDRTLRYLVEARRGASRARNRGLQEARGEIVAFVDGDVRVDRSWLAAIATSMSVAIDDDATSVSCVTGAILPAALETQAQQWMEEWGGYSKGFERGIFDLQAHRTDSPLYPFAAAVFGSGAQMAFRADHLRQLGGFDLALGGGTPSRSGEDLAVFLDLVSSGRALVYEPGAIVWHTHPASEALFRATLRSYGRGLTSYLLRHVSRHPRDAARIGFAIPAAVNYYFRADSPHNSARSASFPRGLWRDEIAGMLLGPFAYAVGRARARSS
jgi:glycosyltransferase involved in cell wall biosynthesis